MATSKRKSFWRDREESSTFWRLLTSQHVSELRLIFFGTLLAVVAVSVSIAYLTNHVTYAALATKDVYTPLDTAKFIGAVIVAGATVMAWHTRREANDSAWLIFSPAKSSRFAASARSSDSSKA